MDHLTFLVAGAGLVAFGLAICGAVYACAATWATRRFLRRRTQTPTIHRLISVLKPLHGEEPELYENLASFCAQDYAGDVQIILGVQHPDDPALDVADRLRRDNPDHDIVVVRNAATHGPNRKIGNLVNMMDSARGDVIVISDSDTRVPPDGLGRIMAALEQPQIGLIHCLYRGRPAGNIWSRLAAMDVDMRFTPSVIVGDALGANPCLGPTMALRRETLERVGGLRQLTDVLADDFELGRAVRAAGYRIASPPLLIDHVFPERTAREMLVHELRWARTIRLVDPAGYVGSGMSHILPLALIGVARSGFSGWSLAALAALAGLRLTQALVLSRLMSSDLSLLWLVPLRDLLSFGVFLAGLFGDHVVWRGNRLRLARGGSIIAA
ncbi:MAG TPA: bacteriohopanetetrol glucosamine biosynthesis glycosyltransferase HpnI [Caulobacteraceae bacterium]